MSKHTPGPWYHDFASGMKNGNAALIEYFVRRDGDSVSIAADIVDPDTCNPSEANARLIAAAPDLLEKCIKVSNWLNRLADAAEQRAKESERFPSLADANRADAMNYRRTAEDIQLVIAKATGDSND